MIKMRHHGRLSETGSLPGVPGPQNSSPRDGCRRVLRPYFRMRTRYPAMACGLFAAACLLTGGCRTEKRPPNIVYILADDMGYGDVSAFYPEGKIRTPALDSLAAQGMRFTDAHAPSSVCTPTRYAILTGEYAWRSRLPKGVLRGYGRALIEQGSYTVSSFLREQGYHTAVIGKWHLGLDWAVREGHEQALEQDSYGVNPQGLAQDMHPEDIDFNRPPSGGPRQVGFDYSFILPASLDMEPYCYLRNDTLTELPTAHTPGNDLNTGYTGAFWRAGKMAPSFEFDKVLDRFADEAVAYLGERAAAGKPFFLYLPLAAPHTPWMPTGGYKGSSGAGTYGDFVQQVDAAIGRVLGALNELQLDGETIVLFASDNGPYWRPQYVERFGHRAAGPYRGMKADIWEGGHRIPFIVRWPGKVRAGSISTATTTLANLGATCADLLGAELPPGAAKDSYSILPVLTGKTDTVPGQEAVVHHSSAAFFAIRRGPWKLVEKRGSGGFSEPQQYEPVPGEPAGQLYNLEDDPAEQQNLYNDYPEKVKELSQLLARIRGR